MRKKPYDDRTDLEKLQSQWNKIGGILQRRKEWSAAIVRAATAAEIAANIAIRKRFEGESTFSADFVNALLRWANGLDGKFSKLMIPSETDKPRRKSLEKLYVSAKKLNKKRNAIVHQGQFSRKKESLQLISEAREIIIGLVRPWEPAFELHDKEVV